MQKLTKARSVFPMQTAKTGYIIVSLILCLLGITLMIRPEVSSALIGTVGGILLLTFGVIKLVGYFSKDLYRLAFQYDLAFGILLLVLGILLLCQPQNLLRIVCIAAGIYVTADGIMKLQTAKEAKEFGIHNWWMILVTAILTSLIGIVLLVRPSESTAFLIRCFGLVILAEGILNLITVLTTVKIIRHQMPDTIDITDYTEGD